MKVAGALLAAGAASRFGGPKALLPFRGSTFVRHLAGELLAVAAPVVVVAPPKPHRIAEALDGLGPAVQLIVNPWAAKGMGSSIAAAARALATRAARADALLLALVDQPLADRELFARLIEAGGATGWAASDYGDGVVGPPALFPREAWPALAGLAGDSGARGLLERSRDRVERVAFADGRVDVDTPGDYERLLEREDGAGRGDGGGASA